MTSRRASIVVAGLLGIVALAWIAWPRVDDVLAPEVSPECAALAPASATAPVPLAASGRMVRPVAGVSDVRDADGLRLGGALVKSASGREDSGEPIPTFSFRLRLRHASGKSVRGRARIAADGVTLDADAGGDAWIGRAPVGTYDLRIDGVGFAGVGTLEDAVTVESEGQQIDVTVPGVRLEGAVADAARIPEFGRTTSGRNLLEIALHSPGGRWTGTMAVHVDDEGRFRFDGVEPGTYVLFPAMAHSYLLDPVGAEVIVEVGEDRDVTGLELRLKAR